MQDQLTEIGDGLPKTGSAVEEQLVGLMDAKVGYLGHMQQDTKRGCRRADERVTNRKGGLQI